MLEKSRDEVASNEDMLGERMRGEGERCIKQSYDYHIMGLSPTE